MESRDPLPQGQRFAEFVEAGGPQHGDTEALFTVDCYVKWRQEILGKIRYHVYMDISDMFI